MILFLTSRSSSNSSSIPAAKFWLLTTIGVKWLVLPTLLFPTLPTEVDRPGKGLLPTEVDRPEKGLFPTEETLAVNELLGDAKGK